jgi:hypothetical protein
VKIIFCKEGSFVQLDVPKTRISFVVKIKKKTGNRLDLKRFLEKFCNKNNILNFEIK